MDNTDIKREVVLVRKRYNRATGEHTLSVRPKPVRKIKRIVASGHRSMSWDGSGHTVGDVLTAKALPFSFYMRRLLNKRGFFTVGMSFKKVLVKFYNEFSVLKKKDESAFVNNVAFKLKPHEDPTADITDVRNRATFDEVTEVTNIVIDTFRNAAEKYQVAINNGLIPEQSLKEEDVYMARATFAIERDLMAKSKKDHYVSSGEFKNTLYWLIGIALVVWLFSKL